MNAATLVAYDHIHRVVKRLVVALHRVHELLREGEIKAPTVDGIALQLSDEHDSGVWIVEMDAGLGCLVIASAKEL